MPCFLEDLRSAKPREEKLKDTSIGWYDIVIHPVLAIHFPRRYIVMRFMPRDWNQWLWSAMNLEFPVLLCSPARPTAKNTAGTNFCDPQIANDYVRHAGKNIAIFSPWGISWIFAWRTWPPKTFRPHLRSPRIMQQKQVLSFQVLMDYALGVDVHLRASASWCAVLQSNVLHSFWLWLNPVSWYAKYAASACKLCRMLAAYDAQNNTKHKTYWHKSH